MYNRYIMVMKVTDASGDAWLSTFNEEAEEIIGCSADELDQLRSQVDEFTMKPNLLADSFKFVWYHSYLALLFFLAGF